MTSSNEVVSEEEESQIRAMILRLNLKSEVEGQGQKKKCAGKRGQGGRKTGECGGGSSPVREVIL